MDDEREEGEVMEEPTTSPAEVEEAPGSDDLQQNAEAAVADAAAPSWRGPPALDFTSPRCLHQVRAPFKEPDNFTKGVKFSPDGTCLLTASEDNVLRVFELPSHLLYQQCHHAEGGERKEDEGQSPPEWPSVIESREGETIYDFAWYPLMQPSEPASCCYLSTSRDHPIHLWDAFTGQLRASYRAYDHMDELSAAYSVAFSPYGDKIFAGFNRMIRVFDTSAPGRSHEDRPTSKTKRSQAGQRGIISALAFSPDASGLYVAGSYAGTVGVYDQRSRSQAQMELTGHEGGVTCLRISLDSRLLFSGARKDPYIHCWDIRKTAEILSSFKRVASTNQRIGLDIDPAGRYLLTGSRDHQALVYDLTTGECVSTIPDVEAVNDVAFHPYAGLVALGTGQRHYGITPTAGDNSVPQEEDDDEDEKEDAVEIENAVRLYQVVGQQPEEVVMEGSETPMEVAA